MLYEVITELFELVERVNSETVKFELDYTFDEPNDPNRYYYRSDHYNYAKRNIPIVFFYDHMTDDYHRITSYNVCYTKLLRISYVLAMIEISKVDASLGVIMSVNNSLVCWGLETYGSDFIKEKYLTPLAQGEKLGAFALSEPEAGSDATKQKTTADKDGDFYVLNGIKNWISNGQSADYHLVMATTDKEKAHKGISTFLVEKGTEGFGHGVKEDKLGIRSRNNFV